MEKKELKTLKNFLIGLLCVVLLGAVCFATYAWFWDRQTYESSDLNFGEIKLDVSGSNVDGTIISPTVERKVITYNAGGKLMPGDTVSLKFSLSLKSGSEPAYYLMFLTGVDRLFDDICYYYDGTTLQTSTETNKKVGTLAVTNGTPEVQEINFSKTISEDEISQGGKMKAVLTIYAVQQANLLAENAFNELYVKGIVKLPTVANIQNALGGASTFKTFTNISFLKSAQVDLSSYSLDETKTSALNSSLSTLYKDKNLIKIYTNNSNSLDVVFASDALMVQSNTCSSFFAGCNALTSLNFSNFNTKDSTSMYSMFNGCTALTSLDLSSFNTSNVNQMGIMFMNCTSLTSLDLSSFDTSNVKSMDNMFSSCTALTSLDLSSFNISNLESMANMFLNCNSLTSLDLSSFSTSNVTNMNSMFKNCSSLKTLDLLSFNTLKVNNMGSMFFGCSKLTNLDLSNFNTSNVTDMSSMFNGCTGLTTLDLSSFSTSNVTNVLNMFYNCNVLTSLDLSSFNTTGVTSMDGMFYGCKALTSLDVSSFDTSNVTSMKNMFRECRALKNLDLSSFNTSSVTTWTTMFSNAFLNNSTTATLTISSNFTYQDDSGNATQFTKTTLSSKTTFNKNIKLVCDGEEITA